MSVGGNWKHKNIHKLLENHISWSADYYLIIVCSQTSYTNYLKELSKTLGIQDKVEFRHNIQFNDLKELYAYTSALVYPSIDEGFGIPPLEAFASLSPAIVSDIPVFHEVLKDNAIYVNPDLKESWDSALNLVSNLEANYLDKLILYANVYNLKNMKEMVLNFSKKL